MIAIHHKKGANIATKNPPGILCARGERGGGAANTKQMHRKNHVLGPQMRAIPVKVKCSGPGGSSEPQSTFGH